MLTGLPIGKRIELVERFIGHRLYRYQELYVREHNDPAVRADLWNKARQIGLSTVALADLLVEAIAGPPNYLALIVSTKQEKANRLLRRTKAMLRMIGRSFYREVVLKENESELVLSSGANILALSGAPRDARSETADRAILDEFAFFEEQGELLTAISPALQRRGGLTIISTPNGPGDVFEDYCSNPDKYGFRLHRVPWWECPDLTPEYMENEKARLQAIGKSFEQEYECSFEQNALSVFSWDLLRKALVSKKRIEKARRVVLGWDPARDRDSSAVVALALAGDLKELVAAMDLHGVPYDEQVSRVQRLALQLGISRYYVDAYAQGDPIADFLGHGKNVVRLKMTKDLNRAAAAYIRHELERDKFSISPAVKDGKEVLRHLYQFNNETGEFPYRTHKGHADYGAALFLAWQAVPRQKRRAARDASADIRRRGRTKRKPAWYALAGEG